MACNTYETYYKNDSFIISNCFLEKYKRSESLPPEAFTNPPLRMSVLKCIIENEPDDGIDRFYDSAGWYYNHPEFTKNYMQAVRGELQRWKMAAISISTESFGIIFATDHKPVLNKRGEPMGDGYIECYTSGEITLLIEMDFQDNLLPVFHRVEYINKSDSEYGQEITITKMIGKRKIKKIQMREDNFGKPAKSGLYCLVTEY